MSEWESVTVTQKGRYAANFGKFVIICDNGKSVDFVKNGGCESLWFFPKWAMASYIACSETASQKKTDKLSGKSFDLSIFLIFDTNKSY